MKNTLIKLFIGLVLFGTLVALTVFDVPNSARLVDLCYAALIGLGIMHLGGQPTDAPSDKQGGFATPLALLMTVAVGLVLAACTSTVTVQSTQVTYTKACAAYGAAFSTALQLRKAGKLDAMQVSQISLIDSQITPVCTGSLPADPDAATQQITAAVTALTIMETVK